MTVVICALIFPLISYGESIESTGKAVIEKGDMRTAYKNALENALIGSVRSYYKSNLPSRSMPDISSEYIKFIKRYNILSRDVTDYTVSVRILTELDTVALKDAGVFINNPVNNAVFVFSGIADNILSTDKQSSLIDNALLSKNFSTGEQRNFQYAITDMENRSQVLDAFKNFYSNYLFIFKFSPTFSDMKNSDNNCELVTTTEVISKDAQNRTLKIETGSAQTNQDRCISESMQKAVISTIDYIRINIIQEPDQNRILLSYKIKAINFKNMVGTNNFISALKQRGFITDYKATSFSGKEVIFQVSSYFNQQELSEKLKSVSSDDLNFTYYTDDNGIVLDFSTVESDNTL